MDKLSPAEHQFFLSVRRGDLSSVKNFVGRKLVKINCYDLWGNSPLYLSCLCGHYSVAEYLLKNGAHFDKDTNEGYRMMIASLTQSIRDLLKDHHQLQTGMKVDRSDKCGFEGFLLRLLNKGIGADLSLTFEGEEFPVHKYILAARAPRMAKFFEDSWRITDILDVNNYFSNANALKSILCYLYTGNVNPTKYHDVSGVVRDCEQLGISTLGPDLQKEAERARKQLFGRLHRPQTNPDDKALRTLTVTLDRLEQFDEVQRDLGELALKCMPTEMHSFLDLTILTDKKKQQKNNFNASAKNFSELHLFPDLIILVGSHQFAIHKAFLIGRSEYFLKLFLHDFEDALDRRITVTEEPQVIPVNGLTPEVFAVILFYIYTDICCPQLDNICDVIYAADMFLFTELMHKCATIIASNLDSEIAVDSYRMGRQMDLEKLCDKCLQFIGKNIELFIEREDFASLLKEEGSDKDMFPMLDDICYYIRSNVGSFDSERHANQMFQKINNILRKADLHHLQIFSYVGNGDGVKFESNTETKSIQKSKHSCTSM